MGVPPPAQPPPPCSPRAGTPRPLGSWGPDRLLQFLFLHGSCSYTYHDAIRGGDQGDQPEMGILVVGADGERCVAGAGVGGHPLGLLRRYAHATLGGDAAEDLEKGVQVSERGRNKAQGVLIP